MTTKEILTIATELKHELDMMNYCAKSGGHYDEYRRSSDEIVNILQNLKIDVVVHHTFDREVEKVIATLIYVRIPKTNKVVFMPCFYSKFDDEITNHLFETIDTFRNCGDVCYRCDYINYKLSGKWGE